MRGFVLPCVIYICTVSVHSDANAIKCRSVFKLNETELIEWNLTV